MSDTSGNDRLRQLGSPNNVPWRLCGMLQRLTTAPPGRARELVEQDGLTSVFLGITAIETFTNIFARTVAEEAQFAHARPQIMDAISEESQMGVVRKLRLLASNAFRTTLREQDERWMEFERLQSLRNRFVHFRTSFETVEVPGITIAGLADTSIYAELTAETPAWVLKCVKGVVELVGIARGVRPENLGGFVHVQLGLVPPVR